MRVNPHLYCKELIPICIAAVVWKHHWSRKRINFRSDNSSVVACLHSGLCHNKHLAFLLHRLSISVMISSFTFTAVHIPGKFNQAADAFSRCQFQVFRRLFPNADFEATPIPSGLVLKLLSPLDQKRKTLMNYEMVQHQFLTFCEENFYLNKSGSQLPASEVTVLRLLHIKVPHVSQTVCALISVQSGTCTYQMDTLTH